MNGTSRFRTVMWTGSIVAVIAITVSVAASWILYQRTITLLTDNLRQRLLSISITEAANISSDSLSKLQTQNDWVTPEWRDVVSRLKKAKDGNPNIVFMYIFRHHQGDPSKMEFVADAESMYPYANTDDNPTNNVDANRDGKIEPEGADRLQWPGQDYAEAVDIPETYKAYDGPLTVKDLYKDSYGSVLTGYAPIRDSQGHTVAVLGTDIKADDFFTVTQETLYPFLVFISVLIAIIGMLSVTLIFIWRHRAQMLAVLSLELERVNSQQENLLHFISHEIKGYLAKGQNAFAGIVEGDYGEAPPKIKEISSGALGEMRKGVSTVMDILDASNLKKGTMSYKSELFDLRDVIEMVISDLKPRAEEKGITLVIRCAPTGAYKLTGDAEKIARHVVRNLIDNALRYTQSGSITASLSQDAKSFIFRVTDTGVGISPDDMPRLFTEGGHGKDSIKVNVDSTGYGLYIAKRVVEAHGGTISVHSDGPGKGSEFTVVLPVIDAVRA